MTPTPEQVAIDQCHAALVYGVAVSQKPKRILELGYGSGRVTDMIQRARSFNGHASHYVLVDSWLDWGGTPPQGIAVRREYGEIEIITSTEEDFVKGCKDQFDLIFSDADHLRSHEWFPEVIEKLLAPMGIAFFHDVMSPDYPNLRQTLHWLLSNAHKGYVARVFDESSRNDERCDRGLLMVMK